MLQKKKRLTREEFNRFFAVGRRIHSPTLQIIFTPNQTVHVAVVVSKKVAKHAVQRNKIRRRMYDIVRNYLKETQVTGVFIFLVKKPILTMEFTEIRKMVRSHLDDIVKKHVRNT